MSSQSLPVAGHMSNWLKLGRRHQYEPDGVASAPLSITPVEKNCLSSHFHFQPGGCWWREAQEIPSISDLRGKKEMSVGGVEEGVKEVEIRGAKTRLG